MRPLEVVIILLDLVAILGLSISSGRKLHWSRFLPTVTGLVTLAQLVREHYRWQMVPAYLLTVTLFLIALPGLLKPTASQPRRRGWVATLGGLGWLLVAVILPALLPVPHLPKPPGPELVGSVSYAWTDAARAETYSGNPTDKREVMVQLWYPAAPEAGAQTGKLIDRLDVAGPAAARFLKLPSFALDHLALVTTHTYPDAPVANTGGPYPVVIVSHGYQGFRAGYFHQMEALASSGYVGVAIDHPYGASFIAFPDGRVVLNNPAILPKRALADEFQRKSEALEAVFAADVRFVMDQLGRLNTGELGARFAGRLDLQRIGLYGHSTGGGAIVWACQLDPRCKAGLGMDAWLEPLPETVVGAPVLQPFLFMRSEHTKVWPPGKNDARVDALFHSMAQDGYRMTILGTEHLDFSLAPLLTPVSALLMERGPLQGERTVQIVTDYLLAFFNQHLKHQPSRLLSGALPSYPEVRFDNGSEQPVTRAPIKVAPP